MAFRWAVARYESTKLRSVRLDHGLPAVAAAVADTAVAVVTAAAVAADTVAVVTAAADTAGVVATVAVVVVAAATVVVAARAAGDRGPLTTFL